MKYKHLISTLILLILCHIITSNYVRKPRSPGLSQVDHIRKQIQQNFTQLWEDIVEDNNIEDDSKHDVKLLTKFQTICNTFAINHTTRFDSLQSLWAWGWTEYQIQNIESYFQQFIRFQQQNVRKDGGMKKPMLAWTDLAETFIQTTDNSISKSLSNLHQITAKHVDKNGNLFEQALQEANGDICHLQQSPQQVIYDLYTAAALADIKGYAMMQFSYMLLRLYDKGNFTTEAQLRKIEFEDRSLEKINAARQAMSRASALYYKCDPKSFIEGGNYERITKLLQGYIENEVNLNPYGTCRENCNYFKYTKTNGCYMDQFCAKQAPCKGSVVNCQYFDSDMNICQADLGSDRRYEYIEYENGKVLGQANNCPNRQLHKVDSWWRYLFWHCSYCFCYCDDTTDSDRYFNLRPATSDMENGKVVTGLKFSKRNRIIHLQIQQGSVGARGVINQTTLSWKPVDSYKIQDHDVEQDKDYFMFDWQNRAVDLDELKAPADYTVTGVKFKPLGSHINFEIRVTPINFTTGQLFPERSYWLDNDNTEASFDHPRTEVKLHHPDIPTRGGIHKKESNHDQYVSFTGSDPEYDAGQSTVPYIDTQKIESNGYLLQGAGIVFRGRKNSGGFLAPAVITWDWSKYMYMEKWQEEEDDKVM